MCSLSPSWRSSIQTAPQMRTLMAGSGAPPLPTMTETGSGDSAMQVSSTVRKDEAHEQKEMRCHKYYRLKLKSPFFFFLIVSNALLCCILSHQPSLLFSDNRPRSPLPFFQPTVSVSHPYCSPATSLQATALHCCSQRRQAVRPRFSGGPVPFVLRGRWSVS